MLEMLAVSREDGWAYVRNDRGIYLVRPPYAKTNLQFADKDTVEKAVGVHGFAVLRKEFDSWLDLITFLNEEVARSRKAKGKKMAKSGVGEQMLKLAPPDVLRKFLDRVEKELLPEREWEHAEKLLLAMLGLPAVCSDGKLLKRVADLLRKTSKARERAEEAKRSLAAPDLSKVSPRTSKRYGEKLVLDYAIGFATRGQILAPA